ncbi:MAG: hypothetical protein ACYDBQ_05470 [Thermoplasmatota archaeon]
MACVPFRYAGFYDVPRLILVPWKGRTYLLQCLFDDALDEYPDNYEVYQMHKADFPAPSGSWEGLTWNANFMGRVPVKSVKFDASHRKELDDDVLRQLHPDQFVEWRWPSTKDGDAKLLGDAIRALGGALVRENQAPPGFDMTDWLVEMDGRGLQVHTAWPDLIRVFGPRGTVEGLARASGLDQIAHDVVGPTPSV